MSVDERERDDPVSKRGAERRDETSDKAVEEIVRMMADGRWRTGASHALIARKYDVSPATVKCYATSASRVLRALAELDKEDVKARLFATLERVVSKAMRTVKPVNFTSGIGRERLIETKLVEHPSLQAAVSAIEVQAKLLGLITNKADVTVRPSVAHLTPDEHRAELERLGAEIAAELERLEAER